MTMIMMMMLIIIIIIMIIIKSFGSGRHCCEYVIWGRGSGMMLAMVPLDGALLSSYRPSIVALLIQIDCGIA